VSNKILTVPEAVTVKILPSPSTVATEIVQTIVQFQLLQLMAMVKF
jgi:hypothetical protein